MVRRRASRAAHVAAVFGGAALAACGATVGPVPAGTFRPPPPLALVALVDPSPSEGASELHQLESVIQAGATPSEAIVVSLLATVPAVRTYVVRGGDTLSSIAAGQGVSLAALQGANPQLGPLAKRAWDRIYPGDRVTVPTLAVGAPGRDAIVARAPAGPPAPALVGAPSRPANATTFQDAQYRRAAAAAEATNRERVAAWRAAAGRQLQPWQADIAGQMQRLASSLPAAGPASSVDDVGRAVEAAANVLAGLPGRRVLLLLAGGLTGGTPHLAPGPWLNGIELIVANAPDQAGAAFAAAATAAGARVTAMAAALTDLELTTKVDG